MAIIDHLAAHGHMRSLTATSFSTHDRHHVVMLSPVEPRVRSRAGHGGKNNSDICAKVYQNEQATAQKKLCLDLCANAFHDVDAI